MEPGNGLWNGEARLYHSGHSILLNMTLQEQLYLETAPRPLKDETESVDVLSDSISKCSLCLEAKRVVIPPTLALDGKGEEYGLQLLFHKGQSYHATCANFWCNAVQEELPTL